MTEAEWLASEEPDFMLEHLIGKAGREPLVEFVRACWRRAEPYLPPGPYERTVADEFADLAPGMTDMDAAVYAAEAALKAARWTPDISAEQKEQTALLRRIVGNPFHAGK